MGSYNYNYRILKFNDIVEPKTILFMFDAYHSVLPNDLQQLFVKYIPLVHVFVYSVTGQL